MELWEVMAEMGLAEGPQLQHIDILVMLSGGIDSVFTLTRLLKETDLVIHAHHIALYNCEKRGNAEAESLRKLVPKLQKIRHCSRKVINGSRQFDITKENVDKMMNYELFEFESYCKICTEEIPPVAAQRVLKFSKKIDITNIA
jgi:tRNA(Ile)-lysidine synthase TilS/MesJ